MMINWGLVIILLLYIADEMTASHHNRSHVRIVNGKSIHIEQAPWQVSLQYYNRHVCGGSILSSTVIATAAHCVQQFNGKQLSIRAGSTFWKTSGQLVKVKKVTLHPQFTVSPIQNDIAILHLTTPLQFSRAIKSIPIANEAPPHGSFAFVSGWGVMKEGTDLISNNLQYTELKIMNRNFCSDSGYSKHPKVLTEGTLCAAADIATDACQGDSGGPLVAYGKLAGIVSWGIGCARMEYPGVYTDVSYYKDWIQKQLRTRKRSTTAKSTTNELKN
ncbi:trypsin beta-like [Drosophila hydei]|uniref:trypsin n=1 Tax=Drosophila hydei TaxID=7224 RepID=A0A6J1LTB7_DROHY|nr:trypsin beta-like [Drosophila hydei]